ncbi:CpsB/CapC family capsule biosynthesis tyrosine phosphatase [Clostridium sp. AM58-1XD]|uniref:CpsB/CapC family capsule biosynthesis tyrosine phosphatase n=1 Tax=Clostridium sp. AM58-1XD TaxID=2292307 RepID=UPI000E51647F|nr:CpsB/CapC family capsule biosynthesis tyrosine phosphatase [Clostridium sp. AM58-1XD]RGY96736.1 hypothetical protein DXA13_16405 [Clostridium sp. AM58-1XD]
MNETAEIIDIHAHILPGLDDGARDMQETRAMLLKAYAQGIRIIIATPHYHYRNHQIQPESIKILTEEVQKIAEQIADDFKIYSGQEIFYAESTVDQLGNGEILTMAGTRYVLVEFSLSASYNRIYRAVRKLIGAGYIPILAHIERYRSLRTEGAVEELTKAGACMQMNYGSLMGFRHLADRRWCRKMILEDQIHFLGTDMHRMDYRPPKVTEGIGWLYRKVDQGQADRLVWGNPVSMLENKFLN